ncbi:MAG TPA: DNA-deoxyinosine glycosylase [Rhodocyclaceae bacterium]
MTNSLKGLAPLVDERARILILGSFPSEASLAAQQYYAHPQNHFWRILGAVIERPLVEMDYAARQAAVKEAGIAIWDVYRGCRREGSLDADIRGAEPNDFARLRKIAPHLARACFNGKTAGRFAPRLAALGFETVVLPSTSPAYTLGFAAKLEAWREALLRG